MPLAAMLMDLEIIIPREINQRQIYDVLYVEKNDTSELTYKTETYRQKTNLWLPKGRGGKE